MDFDPPSQQDTCAYFHTGGTTGLPKLAKHSHLNQLTNGAQVNLISPAEPGDTIFVGLPIFHVNAAVATGIAPIMNRSKILLASPAGYRGKNIISHLPDLIEGFQVGLMMAVPTVYSSLLLELEKNSLASEKLQSLKLAISGAAPLSSELKKQFISKSGVNLIEGYGLTESSSVCTLMPVKNINKKESVGLKIPGMTLKILSFSEQNNEVMECSNDQVGEIVINGNNVFSGYVENIHNENLFVEYEGRRYIRTGDLGSLDEHGYLSLAGRQKEIIIRGGHNIDPKMIEDIAYQHPLVSLAAAVPKPDTYAGEVPVLYVTPTSDSDKERLQKEITVFMKDRTPERAAIPKEVLVIGEMPLTAVGKIFKPKLVCDQITAVINAHLTDILKSEDYIVQTSPTKKRGIFSVIHLQAYLSKELVEKVEDKLTPFAFQYQIEIQNNNKSTHIEATTL
ncbi:AMP-binding protein [Psychrosphaera haliotis]|uniref:AMP-binding protein n=1 Tax=Psychrosphaera haliotis TaxID=555083 RepID=UPI0018C6907D|nr:AMP-binding protein [Psychrosphaera haliotis]